jgi:DNA-binding CsgD family transcriptional regulator
VNRLRELNDPRLWPLIDAPDDAAREAAIESLMIAAVTPLVAAVLARLRRSEPGLPPEDRAEIASHGNVRAGRKLRAAALFEEHAIAALDGYVATLAFHAAHDLRRQRFPERHRLKKKLRHAFSRDPRLALWETLAGIAAGLAQWKGRTDVRSHTNGLKPTPAMRDSGRPADAAVAILEQARAPVVFDAFVNAVAELWNVRDAVLGRDEFPPDARRDQLSALEQRQSMALLWAEIAQLPENQRIALLLNLRDSAGANALVLFLLLNIATAEELAASVKLSERELAELWEHLPLSDLAIAERLNLSRQQVINLRSSARARLSRRTAVRK